MDIAREAIAFLLGFVAALSGAYVFALLQALSRRPRLARVLKFDRRHDVLILYPPRDTNVPEPILPTISIEDFMAIYNIQRLLASAGWDPNRIRMKDMTHWCDDPRDQQQNLVLLCAPWRNTVTQQAMQGLAHVRERYDISLDKGPDGLKHMRFRCGQFFDTTHEQIDALGKEGIPASTGPLDDYALVLTAARGEWAQHGPVLVLSGLRGIGTWGAANHLRRHARGLEKRAGSRGFAIALSVRYGRWDIADTDELNFVSFE